MPGRCAMRKNGMAGHRLKLKSITSFPDRFVASPVGFPIDGAARPCFFFILRVVALIDVIAGFSITISGAAKVFSRRLGRRKLAPTTEGVR